MFHHLCSIYKGWGLQGRIQDFKLGGTHFNKNCADRREARKLLGYFVWKITILCQKILFLPIIGGARAGCAPPGSAPGLSESHIENVVSMIRSITRFYYNTNSVQFKSCKNNVYWIVLNHDSSIITMKNAKENMWLPS